jgi:hypothetical protein
MFICIPLRVYINIYYCELLLLKILITFTEIYYIKTKRQKGIQNNKQKAI